MPRGHRMASVVTALLMFVVAAAAWLGMGWMILNVPPARPLAVAASFVFALTGITATASLGAWLILRPRLHEGRLRSPAGYLAHAMLLGVIALFALWLQ